MLVLNVMLIAYYISSLVAMIVLAIQLIRKGQLLAVWVAPVVALYWPVGVLFSILQKRNNIND